MAKMCFGRAGDAYWERRSKASGLRATAAHKRHSDELLKASAFVLGKSGIGIVYKVVLEDVGM